MPRIADFMCFFRRKKILSKSIITVEVFGVIVYLVIKSILDVFWRKSNFLMKKTFFDNKSQILIKIFTILNIFENIAI